MNAQAVDRAQLQQVGAAAERVGNRCGVLRGAVRAFFHHEASAGGIEDARPQHALGIVQRGEAHAVGMAGQHLVRMENYVTFDLEGEAVEAEHGCGLYRVGLVAGEPESDTARSGVAAPRQRQRSVKIHAHTGRFGG